MTRQLKLDTTLLSQLDETGCNRPSRKHQQWRFRIHKLPQADSQGETGGPASRYMIGTITQQRGVRGDEATTI